MLLARISCFFSFPLLPQPLFSSIAFINCICGRSSSKKNKGGIGVGAGCTGHVRCYKRHKLFCSRVVSAAFRVAIRSNIAKDTEYMYILNRGGIKY